MNKWVVFQLSERGESALNDEPRLIEEVISKFVESEYFLPVYYNNSKSYDNKIFLFKGYIFIKFNPKEIKQYGKIAKTQYFIGPLAVNKRLSLVEDSEVAVLKEKLNKLTYPDIKKGENVKIIDGKYKNMIAKVLEYYVDAKEADLEVNLKCMNILVPRVPIVCLRNHIEEKKS